MNRPRTKLTNVLLLLTTCTVIGLFGCGAQSDDEREQGAESSQWDEMSWDENNWE